MVTLLGNAFTTSFWLDSAIFKKYGQTFVPAGNRAARILGRVEQGFVGSERLGRGRMESDEESERMRM